MAELLYNLVTDTVASGHAVGLIDATVTPSVPSNWPVTGNYRIEIDSELLKVTSNNGTVLNVVRAQEGTTATTHAQGATIKLVPTAQGINQWGNDLLTTITNASAPRASMTLSYNGSTTGLTTVFVTVLTKAGGVLVARTLSGVSESGTIPGLYEYTLDFVTVAPNLEFLVKWDEGVSGTFTPQEITWPAGAGSVWRYGSGAPSNALGVNNDFYLQTDTGDVWQRLAGSYSIQANIQGPTGATGPSGGAVAGSASPAMDGTAAAGVAAAVSHEDHVHPTDTSRAPLASPTFTGTVTLPSGLVLPASVSIPTTATAVTQSTGDATTKVATDAFVQQERPRMRLPARFSYLEWNYDPALGDGTGGGLTSGLQVLSRLDFLTTQTWTQVTILIVTAGSGLTSGQNFLFAVNSSGTRLGVSADQTTAFASAGYKDSGSFGSQTTNAGDFIYVGILSVGSTMPKPNRLQTLNNASNGPLTGALAYGASNGSGKTAVDAFGGSPALSSNTTIGTWFWAAVK